MAAHRVTAVALALLAVLGWWALPETGAGSGMAGSGMAGSDVARAAAPSYRFWTYWHRAGGSWVYADTGPSGYRPADGSVDGWRYEVTADGAARAPRTTATFAQICGSTPAVTGRARVAIVFDYGTAGDARRGQHPPANRGACAVIAPGSSGIAALEAVATLRFRSDGIICAFGDYPSSGCVDLVGQPTAPSASPRPTIRRTPRPTRKPTPRVTVEPTRPATRTPTPTPTAETRSTTPTATARLPTAPTDRPSPPPSPPSRSHSSKSRSSAPASSPTPSAPPGPRPARATRRATSRASLRASEPSLAAPSMSSAASASISTSAEPGGAPAVAGSAAGLVLTGDSRPTTSGVGLATWVGLAVLLLLGGTAGVLALRRRRGRQL